jgi:hypothetical protein
LVSPFAPVAIVEGPAGQYVFGFEVGVHAVVECVAVVELLFDATDSGGVGSLGEFIDRFLGSCH